MIRPALPLVLLLPLAACGMGDDESTEGNATTFSIHAQSDEGNTTITGDGGKVGIRIPGFEGTIDIPGFQLKSDDLDIDGVKLYPGTTITHFGIRADDRGNRDSGSVDFEFVSPAGREAVVEWFRERFAEEDMTVAQTEQGFTGTTSDDDHFTLTLTADGDEKTQGKFTIGD
ncbi:hypothetical protein [Stakelama tenebrarum]|uniref:Uncharacterized protein n=1 Tax=Stakelama tenebrarum TaxID=2711215 RepID=A0A6G6Y0G8_9SPHN|nr:hypothetical protein [Sphingosinithalassobacter tenebrarum]QIG78399.1 hypothetical protein G5C33_00375 [Sphingosinithalassobacter tenebrarum]